MADWGSTSELAPLLIGWGAWGMINSCRKRTSCSHRTGNTRRITTTCFLATTQRLSAMTPGNAVGHRLTLWLWPSGNGYRRPYVCDSLTRPRTVLYRVGWMCTCWTCTLGRRVLGVRILGRCLSRTGCTGWTCTCRLGRRVLGLKI